MFGVGRFVVKSYLVKLERLTAFVNNLQKRQNFDYPQCRIQPRLTRCMKKWKRDKELTVLKNKACLTLAAYTTADHYNLEDILKQLKREDKYRPCELTSDNVLLRDICNVLHVRGMPNRTENSHVYFFDVGTVVMWNLTHFQREDMLNFLQPFEECAYSPWVVRSSSELLSFKYTESNTSFLYDNTLYFGVADKTVDMIGLNRFLISSAISLSTKMSAFENMLEQHICTIERVTNNMKCGKELGVQQDHVMATAGVAYSTKHSLKQSTDSLLLPWELLDQFHSEDEQESFSNTFVYFRLPMRLKVFDDNLLLCERYTTLLFNHLSYRQNVRFQKIVIVILLFGMGIGSLAAANELPFFKGS